MKDSDLVHVCVNTFMYKHAVPGYLRQLADDVERIYSKDWDGEKRWSAGTDGQMFDDWSIESKDCLNKRHYYDEKRDRETD